MVFSHSTVLRCFANVMSTLLRAPTTMGTTVAILFHNLLSSIRRSLYLSSSSSSSSLFLLYYVLCTYQVCFIYRRGSERTWDSFLLCTRACSLLADTSFRISTNDFVETFTCNRNTDCLSKEVNIRTHFQLSI